MGRSDHVTDVLLMVADQWRGDGLGLLGTPGVRTPNLDSLAAEGVAFTNHWCQASPCGPARRSMLSGTEVRTHGQWTNDQPAIGSLPSLADGSARAGLSPRLIGYTDTPSPAWDAGRGWRGSLDSVPTEEEVGAALHDPGFRLVRPFFWQLGFPAYRRHLAELGIGPLGSDMLDIAPPARRPDRAGLAPSSIPAARSDTAWLTDAAVDLLDEAAEPMLLHLNWLRPHPPLVAPAPYHRLVDPDEVALPGRRGRVDDWCGSHPFYASAAAGRPMGEYLQESRPVETVTEADDRRLRAAYYGLMAEVDHHLGRVVDRLRATDRWDSTLVVFVSDHGDALGDRWLYGRRGPFDGHFRVPCIVRDPRPSADPTRGTRIDRFTTNLDLLPTVLEAVDGRRPAGVEGRSLGPLLRGEPDPDRPGHVRCEMDWSDHGPRGRDGRRIGGHRFTMIRSDRHRYVRFHRAVPGSMDGSRAVPGSMDGSRAVPGSMDGSGSGDESSRGPGLGSEGDVPPPMLFDLVEDPDQLHDLSADPTRAGVLAELSALAE